MYPGGFPVDETTSSPDALTVLLVDDSWAFLGSAEHFLSMEPNLQVVGYATTGLEALDQIGRLRPDLVLMDVAMPRMNGLAATRRLKEKPDAPRIIMLTVHNLAEYRRAAAEAGADGFLAKSEFGCQLLPLIRKLFVPAPAAN
jgi:DNA-binding NarL/FixJ family response regulator